MKKYNKSWIVVMWSFVIVLLITIPVIELIIGVMLSVNKTNYLYILISFVGLLSMFPSIVGVYVVSKKVKTNFYDIISHDEPEQNNTTKLLNEDCIKNDTDLHTTEDNKATTSLTNYNNNDNESIPL